MVGHLVPGGTCGGPACESRASNFVFQISDFKFWVSVFLEVHAVVRCPRPYTIDPQVSEGRPEVEGGALRELEVRPVEFRVSRVVFQVSGFRFQVSGFGFQIIRGFEFQIIRGFRFFRVAFFFGSTCGGPARRLCSGVPAASGA